MSAAMVHEIKQPRDKEGESSIDFDINELQKLELYNKG